MSATPTHSTDAAGAPLPPPAPARRSALSRLLRRETLEERSAAERVPVVRATLAERLTEARAALDRVRGLREILTQLRAAGADLPEEARALVEGATPEELARAATAAAADEARAAERVASLEQAEAIARDVARQLPDVRDAGSVLDALADVASGDARAATREAELRDAQAKLRTLAQYSRGLEETVAVRGERLATLEGADARARELAASLEAAQRARRALEERLTVVAHAAARTEDAERARAASEATLARVTTERDGLRTALVVEQETTSRLTFEAGTSQTAHEGVVAALTTAHTQELAARDATIVRLGRTTAAAIRLTPLVGERVPAERVVPAVTAFLAAHDVDEVPETGELFVRGASVDLSASIDAFLAAHPELTGAQPDDRPEVVELPPETMSLAQMTAWLQERRTPDGQTLESRLKGGSLEAQVRRYEELYAQPPFAFQLDRAKVRFPSDPAFLEALERGLTVFAISDIVIVAVPPQGACEGLDPATPVARFLGHKLLERVPKGKQGKAMDELDDLVALHPPDGDVQLWELVRDVTTRYGIPSATWEETTFTHKEMKVHLRTDRYDIDSDQEILGVHEIVPTRAVSAAFRTCLREVGHALPPLPTICERAGTVSVAFVGGRTTSLLSSGCVSGTDTDALSPVDALRFQIDTPTPSQRFALALATNHDPRQAIAHVRNCTAMLLGMDEAHDFWTGALLRIPHTHHG